MRKISASYIFTGTGNFIKNGIIEIDHNGVVLDVIDTKGELKEIANLEHYNGILCPGFVNTHCHLELSYMHNLLNRTENLAGFVKQMIEKRKTINTDSEQAIIIADRQMKENGIVACGDISNTDKSFKIKAKSKIKYYNFIEVLGLNEDAAEEIINKAKNTANKALQENAGMHSISPHASYSLSLPLLKEVKENAELTGSVISFHNQESKEESDIFSNKPNSLSKILGNIGLNKNTFPITNKSSLESLLPFLPTQNNILLIHNVFTKAEDIILAHKHFAKYFWVFCPKSNLFISNNLPNIPIFLADSNNICIGTDSLASNNTLSIIEEITTLQINFPQLKLEQLLQWSTVNGAKALNFNDTIGSFEKGKTPGVNLIYNLDLQNLKLTTNTEIKVIA